MSVIQRKPMTRKEFLMWEERQPLRYEFDGSVPVFRDGCTCSHATIQNNLTLLVSNCLSKPCEYFGSNLKIATAVGYRYPDSFVVCTPGEGSSTVVEDPVVIFEVFSPDTASVDIFTKNQEYAGIPSVRRYVMLAQDCMGALVFARIGGDWVGHVISGDATLYLPEIGIELPLSELYVGVDLTADG